MFYRTITRVSVKALFYNKDEKSTQEVTFPNLINSNKVSFEREMMKNGHKGMRFMDILDWTETEERRYMDETVFVANAVKLDKPNPLMVTRTIKAEVLTAHLCHRFNDDFAVAFATCEIVLDINLKGKAREKAIISKIPADYVVRRAIKTGEISDLYGMDLLDFIRLSKSENEI